MTEGERCKNCEALLLHDDERALDECRTCRDRTWKHLFDESDDGTCRACGYLESFGALHLPVQPEVEDDPRPQFCARCPHVEHAGACPDALPAYPKARPCPCTGEQAAA